MPQSPDEQLVVVSQVYFLSYLNYYDANTFLIMYFVSHFFYLENFCQVLVADINIGYEDIVNTQVRNGSPYPLLLISLNELLFK